jgi:F-box associated region/PLD-like domain
MRMHRAQTHRFKLKSLLPALVVALTLAGAGPSRAGVYQQAPFLDNLLTNPNGDTGDLSGWIVTSNGGDGWEAHSGDHQDLQEDNGFLTSYHWAIREQTVDLLAQGFSEELLDAQPTILISELFEKVFCADKFFISVDLLDRNFSVIRSWTSGEQQHRNTACDYSGYKDRVSTELTHYGRGVRYIRWRDGGKDSEWWSGHFGPKLQNAYLALTPANLLNQPEELSSWTILENGGNGFLVTGAPDARQFMTSYGWGRRQQVVDLLALGLTASELDSGKLPIIARSTYGERACPDKFYLKVELLDQNHRVLSARDSGVRTHDGECDWTYSGYAQTVHHRFVDYPAGVRYIRWEDGGVDSEYWAGHFGATLQQPYLAIINYGNGFESSRHGRILSMEDYLPVLAIDAIAWTGAIAGCILTTPIVPVIGCMAFVGGTTVVTAAANYTLVPSPNNANKVHVVPVAAQPTDPQLTPGCDTDCKMDKISQGLAAQAQGTVWSEDRVNDAESITIFSSPHKDHPTNLKAPNEQLKAELVAAVRKGRKLIDITALSSIENPWIAELNTALKAIDQEADLNSEAPVVRVYLGLPPEGYSPIGSGAYPQSNWNAHLSGILDQLTKDLPGRTDMTIYIGGGRTDTVAGFATSWNHSKIVAIDGTELFSGGHNLWHQYFIANNPLFDVSLKLAGDPALSAHRFADKLWEHQRNSFLTDRYTLLWRKKLVTGNIGLVPNSYTLLDVVPAGGAIRVLSVGQTGTTDYESPVQRAVLNMVNAAEKSIYISQQALVHPWFSQILDAPLINSLVRRTLETPAVSVEIVLSSVDSPHHTESYVNNKLLLRYVWQTAVVSGVKDNIANREKFCNHFKVSSLRVSGKSEHFANHAKVLMLDKQIFLIGSHNLYEQAPMQLSEYAHVIADPTKAGEFFKAYFQPLLQDSERVNWLECPDYL